MYSAFKSFCERLLRIPPQPEPPPGDEAKTRIFLAATQYYKYLLVMWVLKTVVPLIFLAVFLIIPLIAALVDKSRGAAKAAAVILIIEAVALVFLVVSRVFALAMVKLDFEKRWYVVTDRSLRVREGVVLVREATVTFANIQNISISQGPIQRMLGIADLRVDTAGGGGSAGAHGKHQLHSLHTTWFRGVNNANEIRELMQQRLKQLKDSGLGDHEELHQPAGATPMSSNFMAALREVNAEAVALREAASRRAQAA